MNRWVNVIGHFEYENKSYSDLRAIYADILKNGHYESLTMSSHINDDHLELRIDGTFFEDDSGDMENFKALCEALSNVNETKITIKSGWSGSDSKM